MGLCLFCFYRSIKIIIIIIIQKLKQAKGIDSDSIVKVFTDERSKTMVIIIIAAEQLKYNKAIKIHKVQIYNKETVRIVQVTNIN